MLFIIFQLKLKMLKQELRQKYKSLRQHLSEETINELSLAIANKTLQLPIWNRENYQLFLSINEHKEVNTDYLVQVLFGKDKNIIISRSDFENRTMAHILLTDSTVIRKNKWNIPEPIGGIPVADELIDVVFLPLLAFDKKGNRVGYGKGFYDIFLSKCKKDVIKVGVSFFEAEQEIEDASLLDIPLDYAVTPQNIYMFNS